MRVGRLSESLFTAFLPSFSEPQRDGKCFKVQECKQPFASSLCRGSSFESKPKISSDVDKTPRERRKQIAISDMTQTQICLVEVSGICGFSDYRAFISIKVCADTYAVASNFLNADRAWLVLKACETISRENNGLIIQ